MTHTSEEWKKLTEQYHIKTSETEPHSLRQKKSGSWCMRPEKAGKEGDEKTKFSN
jgi:hypothetical protein